jgi:hypothetical protein
MIFMLDKSCVEKGTELNFLRKVSSGGLLCNRQLNLRFLKKR